MAGVTLAIAAATDTGLMRKHNEDSLLVRELGDATLLCVADGLGGHARGEWASARAVEVFADAVAVNLESFHPDEAMSRAAAAANSAVNEESAALEARGAATTLVAALVVGSEAWWLNVGDSRFYAVTRGEFRQVSNDHSWVADRVREGTISAETARAHWKRNVVTKTIGFEPLVVPDLGRLDVAAGDCLLLCSDGLFGPVEDKEIAGVLDEFSTDDAANRLIELANHAGGPDNITVIVARVEG
ncbi:MAG: PP2C family serine/threonine-protein phosphatase [Dehalococcoidia bacterium]